MANPSELLIVRVLVLVMLVAVGCSQTKYPGDGTTTSRATSPQSGQVSSASVVKASANIVEIAAGSSAEAQVRLAIQAGYHINANPATDPYLKPTELALSASDGISVGFIVYPDPLTKKFPFSERPLAVYESEALLKVSLKADKSAKSGPRHLLGEVRIQACDDQVCYPPGTIDLKIPVNVIR
jgi:DsbC/DsbD-like thiol-disulfide interchange protein